MLGIAAFLALMAYGTRGILSYTTLQCAETHPHSAAPDPSAAFRFEGASSVLKMRNSSPVQERKRLTNHRTGGTLQVKYSRSQVATGGNSLGDLVVNNSIRFLCCLSVMLLLVVSCGKQEPKVRDKSFLSAKEPVKVGDLTHASLVRNSQGDFFITAFIHSTFPSATEAHEAIAVFKSADNCATWQEISRIPSFVTYGVWGCDLAIGEDDSLYFTWVAAVYDANMRQPFKAIMFSRSDDGGRSWTEPIYVNDILAGQRWHPVMAVSGDNVYTAWLDSHRHWPGPPGRTMQQDVCFASSADRGETWSANVTLETALDRKESPSGMPSICVGADGTVYCAYFSIRKHEKKNRNVGGYWIAKSTDRGETFTICLHNIGPLGPISIAEEDGKLYLASVYLMGVKRISWENPETYQEIRLYVSSDGGEDWREHVVVDDDPDHKHKMNLQIVPLGGGRLIACWDDDRGGVYMAASTDGGRSWGKNLKVAEKSHVGSTPLDIAADGSSGTFVLLASDIRKGAGDAIFLVKGKIAP